MYTPAAPGAVRVAVAQICSRDDVHGNLELVRAQVREASERGAHLVVFPEATMRAFGHDLGEIAEEADGAFADAVAEAAREGGLWVVVGMFRPGTDGRVRNTLLATDGRTRLTYDKIHLYDAFGFAESDTVTPGEGLVRFPLAGTEVAVATCYDVRFPQLFIENARAGAGLQVVCASWGDGPGKAEQWDLLVRARALDSTSYLVACDQAMPSASGVAAPSGAPTGIGRSAVIAPNGTVLHQAGAGPELLVADLPLDAVERTRSAIPVLANARLS